MADKDYKRKSNRAEGSDDNEELMVEGRNAVIEAFRSGLTVDRLYLQEGELKGSIQTVVSLAKAAGVIINYVPANKMNYMSKTGKHQGVIAKLAAFPYASVEDILKKAEEKGEKPFIFILDGIEDPHNLGAIIRTANLSGAHGVIIPKRRSAGLTEIVAKTSAGAIYHTPVAKVTNIASTIEDLKKAGLWFVCADMGGSVIYDIDMKGPTAIVIGNEGEGVSRLVKESCDFIASIPMSGDIDSLNASVAAGIMAFEVVRQRKFS